MGDTMSRGNGKNDDDDEEWMKTFRELQEMRNDYLRTIGLKALSIATPEGGSLLYNRFKQEQSIQSCIDSMEMQMMGIKP